MMHKEEKFDEFLDVGETFRRVVPPPPPRSVRNGLSGSASDCNKVFLAVAGPRVQELLHLPRRVLLFLYKPNTLIYVK